MAARHGCTQHCARTPCLSLCLFPRASQYSENMSAAKKQRTTSAAVNGTPTASPTPIHPWVKLMTKHDLTLEEVAKLTYKVASEGPVFEQEKQAKFEPPTRLKKTVSDATPKSGDKQPTRNAINVKVAGKEAQNFDYLVVAANPRELMGYGLSVLSNDVETLQVLDRLDIMIDASCVARDTQLSIHPSDLESRVLF